MAAQRDSKFRRLLLSKPLVILIIILMAFIASLEYKQIQKRSKYNKEIAELQKQEQELVAENEALQKSLEYFNNEGFKEQIARRQLNLKKEGEIVVNFPSSTQTAPQPQDSAPPVSNPQKWWNYFFNRTN